MDKLKEEIYKNIVFKLRRELERADIKLGGSFYFNAHVRTSNTGEPDADQNPSNHQPSNRHLSKNPLTATTEATMESRIRLTCSECGSTDVGRDGWAAWDEDKQEYVMRNVFDQGYCFTCEGETKINEENIDD